MACCRVATKLHRLRILLKTENTVVEHDNHDGHIAADQSFKFGPTVRKAAISDQGYDRTGRPRQLGADSKWQSPAESGQTAGRDEALARRSATKLTDNPHRRVACVGNNDRLRRQTRLELVHHTLRPDWTSIAP